MLEDGIELTVTYRRGPSGIEVTDFRARHPGGHGIPTERLRDLATRAQEIAELAFARSIVEANAERVPLPEGTLTLGTGDDARTFELGGGELVGKDHGLGERLLADVRKQRRRRTITPALLDDVAKVYLANPASPTKSVQAEFHVARAQAARYVRAAREAGLLPSRETE